MSTGPTPHDHATRPRPDDTPPRNRVIFAYTVLGVLTLGGLKFVFDSYLDVMRQQIRHEHIDDSHTTEVLSEYRDQQHQRLAGGSMPIERAVRELGRRGRSAFPLIRPTPSEDLDPLRGWAQLPRELPPGAQPLAEVPPAEVPPPPAPEGAAVPPAEGALVPPPEGALRDGTLPATGQLDAPPAVPAEARAAAPAAAAPAIRPARPRPAAPPEEAPADPAPAPAPAQ